MACKLKIKIENRGQKIHNSAHIVTEVFNVLFNDAANCYISTALVTDAMAASKKNDPKTKQSPAARVCWFIPAQNWGNAAYENATKWPGAGSTQVCQNEQNNHVQQIRKDVEVNECCQT